MTSFFDLPLEIRFLIYRELLIRVGYVKPAVGRYAHEDPPAVNELYPSILSTCKQAFAEGSMVLYEENTFHFDCGLLGGSITCFRNQFAKLEHNFKKMKHLEISLCASNVANDNPFDPCMNLLSRTVSLASLHCSLKTLRLAFTWFGPPVTFGDDAHDEPRLPQIIAGHADLRAAVASFDVKASIEINVSGYDKGDCLVFGAFVDSIKSSKQWAATFHWWHYRVEGNYISERYRQCYMVHDGRKNSLDLNYLEQLPFRAASSSYHEEKGPHQSETSHHDGEGEYVGNGNEQYFLQATGGNSEGSDNDEEDSEDDVSEDDSDNDEGSSEGEGWVSEKFCWTFRLKPAVSRY